MVSFIADVIKKKRGPKKAHSGSFKKGCSGNPGGRALITKEAKGFRKVSYDNFVNKLQEYGGMTNAELKEELRRPDISNFDLMFGNVVNSAATGDRYARELLMDRLWGKAKETTLVAFETEHDMMKKIPMQDLIELYHKHNKPTVIDVNAVDNVVERI